MFSGDFNINGAPECAAEARIKAAMLAENEKRKSKGLSPTTPKVGSLFFFLKTCLQHHQAVHIAQGNPLDKQSLECLPCL